MRLAMLGENEIVRRIKALVRLRDELKAVGQRFGSDSVVTKRIFSAAAYDIQVDDVRFKNRVIELTFTPDNPDDPNTSLVYKMRMTKTQLGDNFVDAYIERRKPVNGVQKWRIYLNGSDFYPVTWVRLKFYFYASGNGQFTATLI